MVIALAFRHVVADDLVPARAVAVRVAHVEPFDALFFGGGGGEEEGAGEGEDAGCEGRGEVVVCEVEDAGGGAGGGEAGGGCVEVGGGGGVEEGGHVDCGEWGFGGWGGHGGGKGKGVLIEE